MSMEESRQPPISIYESLRIEKRNRKEKSCDDRDTKVDFEDEVEILKKFLSLMKCWQKFERAEEARMGTITCSNKYPLHRGICWKM